MRTLLFLLALFFFYSGNSQNWQWANYALGDNKANCVKTDGYGNVYVAGQYKGSNNFSGVSINGGFHYDAFLSKYSPSGNLVWIRFFTGSNDEVISDICIDNSGNILVTGSTTSTDFNWSPGTSGYFFVVKFNPYGTSIWFNEATSVGNGGFAAGLEIATDNLNNVIVTGWMNGTLSFGSDTITSSGPEEIFLAKYSSNGISIWTKKLGDAEPAGVKCDVVGNIFLSGFVFANSGDSFLSKIDASGNEEWRKYFNGSSVETATALEIDSGYIYVGGDYLNTIGFDNDTLFNYTSGGSYHDIFIAKYDTSGNEIWAKSFGGNGDDYLTSIVKDNQGRIWLTGYYLSPQINFGSLSQNNYGAADGFLLQMNSSGNPQWNYHVGGTNNDMVNYVACDPIGNIYLTGSFSDDVISFDTITLDNTGYNEAFFLSKMGANSLGSKENIQVQNLRLYPNPHSQRFTVQYTLQKNTMLSLTLYDAAGRPVYTESREELKGAHFWKIDTNGLERGIYFLELKENNQRITKKVVVE